MRSPDLRRCLYNVPLSLAALEKPRMSIKSDRWIRRMAEQHGMVEPFESGQVRHAADGHRIVSYGTSSYGYDVRRSREFKIFTNINSTIVDPQAFDPGTFVDVESYVRSEEHTSEPQSL